MFSISDLKLNRDDLHSSLLNSSAGAIVVFEGWVRNHNEGKQVQSLEYQVYHELALKEGERILREAREKFNLHDIRSVHREGHLALGEIAIWIGATASHRDDAFKACRYVIDEIKHRLPVWKKEHYVNEKPQWVLCRHLHHHVHFSENDYYQKNLAQQDKLKKASVLVIGAGGLGCPALVGLASAGVGRIAIVDPDVVEISNVHRQFLYSPNLVGEKKAVVASKRLKELNPFINVEPQTVLFDVSLVDHDLVLDCTDSMQSKYEIHDACLKKRVPLITASVFKHEGQLRTIVPGQGCLRCLSKATPDDGLLGNCNDQGVLGTTVNVLGSMQAAEAIEFLQFGKNASLQATIYLDLKNLSQMKVKNLKVQTCVFCAGEFDLSSLSIEALASDGLVVDIRNGIELEEYKLMKTKVILACDRGITSRKLAESLRAKGYENFYSLKGGFAANFNTQGPKSCAHHSHY